MDLSIPFIDDNGVEYLDRLMYQELPELNIDMFVQFYNTDKLGGMIRNLETWLNTNFSLFNTYKL